MYKECIALMKQQGVEFAEGLSPNEIVTIEKTYGIRLPKAYESF